MHRLRDEGAPGMDAMAGAGGASKGETAEVMALEAALRDALRPVEPPPGFAERVRERLRAQAAVAPGHEGWVAGPAMAAKAEGREASGHPVRGAPGETGLRKLAGPVKWRMAAAAMLLLTVLLGGWGAEQRRERRERAEAARASEQFALAMQVTVRSLNKVGSDLERLESRGGAQ